MNPSAVLGHYRLVGQSLQACLVTLSAVGQENDLEEVEDQRDGWGDSDFDEAILDHLGVDRQPGNNRQSGSEDMIKPSTPETHTEADGQREGQVNVQQSRTIVLKWSVMKDWCIMTRLFPGRGLGQVCMQWPPRIASKLGNRSNLALHEQFSRHSKFPLSLMGGICNALSNCCSRSCDKYELK